MNPDYPLILYSGFTKGEPDLLVANSMDSKIVAMLAPDSDIAAAIEDTVGVPLEASAAQAQEGVRRLYRHGNDTATLISQRIEEGLAAGWTKKRMVAEVEATAGVPKRWANMIATTEVNAAFNDSTKTRAVEAGLSVMWIAIGDRNTCVYCVDRNGKIYDPQKIRMPPHPWDRCQLSPVDPDWFEDGLLEEGFWADYRQQGIDELAKQGKRPNRGPAPFEVEAPNPLWMPRDGWIGSNGQKPPR